MLFFPFTQPAVLNLTFVIKTRSSPRVHAMASLSVPRLYFKVVSLKRNSELEEEIATTQT